jgi:hypothetical protein
MRTVWVVEPREDGTCRCYRVTTFDDGSFEIGEPFVHWTSMVLFDSDRKTYDVLDGAAEGAALPRKRAPSCRAPRLR